MMASSAFKMDNLFLNPSYKGIRIEVLYPSGPFPNSRGIRLAQDVLLFVPHPAAYFRKRATRSDHVYYILFLHVAWQC